MYGNLWDRNDYYCWCCCLIFRKAMEWEDEVIGSAFRHYWDLLRDETGLMCWLPWIGNG